MHSIGVRVKVQKKGYEGKIYYSVISFDGKGEFKIIKNSFINIPNALDVPEKLAYIRTNFLALIMRYNIELAGLRITESVAGSQIIFRAHIEGVFQELFANSTIKTYSLLNLVHMGSLLGFSKEKVKSSIQHKENILDIDQWNSLKVEERECILASTSMINKELN